uniref:transaldolase family protein n=1 Tax=Tessaracoccus timonensis TaxID=2161816 RepID=UPI000D55013A|nr:transaldolase family protein [Tessaracoccus timonensis]
MLMLDSVDMVRIGNLLETSLFQGITSNPTILARAGLSQDSIPDLYARAEELGASLIAFQSIGENERELRVSAEQIAQLGPRVIVKLPALREAYSIARNLVDNGVRVLLTAVYHPTQALLAGDMSVWGIAPYAGRLYDFGADAVETIGTMVDILQGSTVRVLAASLRNPELIAQLSARGVSDFTVSPSVADSLVDNSLTIQAVNDFMSDAKKPIDV